MRDVKVSDALAKIVGSNPMPRTEVTKSLWAYIKEKNLQDPSDKRNIKPDPVLAAVLGSTHVISMFEMTRQVAKHISERD